MTRTLSISDGTTTISLIDIAGVQLMDQANPSTITEEMLLGLEGYAAETFRLNIFGTSTDNAATNISNFVAMLRKAVRYKREKTQRKPVYLIEQLTGETGARYAQIIGVPTLERPFMFRNPLELDHYLENGSITVLRAHPWSAYPPGTMPAGNAALLTLTATDGPAAPTLAPVANFRENNIGLTHVFVYDASVGYSANQVANAALALFPASPAVGDRLLFGSTAGFPKLIGIPVGTLGAYSMTLEIGYCKGGGAPSYVALVDGTSLTRFPTGGVSELFKSQALWMIAANPPTDAALATINSVSAYWVYVEIKGFVSCATVPVTNAVCFLQRTPHIEISNTAIGGDAPPVLLQRLFAPTGGGSTPSMGCTSRAVVGAKSDIDSVLDYFVSHLNTGGDGNPAAWAASYGTDSSAVANLRAPGGKHAAVSFATNAASAVRVTLLGTAMTRYWKGDFRVFARAEQVGGAAGDCRMRLRAMLGGSTAGYPLQDFDAVALGAHDAGWELVELIPNGILSLPFSGIEAQDLMAQDLVLQIFAERLTGTATLNIADLILIPVDEWAVELSDPDTDTASGGGALKGDNVLDVDDGVIAYRTIKFTKSGANLYNQDTWTRGNLRTAIEPLTKTRLYYVLGYYPTTFGVGPFAGAVSMMLGVSLYLYKRFQILRGSG